MALSVGKCAFVYPSGPEPKPMSIWRQLSERGTSNCENYCGVVHPTFCSLHVPEEKKTRGKR